MFRSFVIVLERIQGGLRMRSLSFLISAFCIFLNSGACAQDPQLQLKDSERKIALSRTDLMKMAQKITIDPDPVYGKKMSYLAVPIKSLMEKLQMSPTAMIQFTAWDGFASVISMGRLLTTPHAEAFLAVESDRDPWPILEKKGVSAGPFYLVWVRSPDASVRPEEWPYQISEIEVVASLEKTYPKVFPVGPKKSGDPIFRGFEVFVQNCFACHTMNKEGAATLGPDLNLPYNPMEYMKEKYLWKF